MPTKTQYLFLVVLIFAVCLSGNEVYAYVQTLLREEDRSNCFAIDSAQATSHRLHTWKVGRLGMVISCALYWFGSIV